MATDLNSQLIARQLAQRQQPQGNPLASALGDVNKVGNAAKLAKPFLDGNTLGGLLGKGAGFAGGSLMGDVIPGAGAALGIYNMIQNKGNLSNILSGMGTGASIGSIIPGLGTLIGGGIGALAGGVEDLFNIGKPSDQELQGRDVNSQIQKQMSSRATPTQLAEAQKSAADGHWNDMNGPLQIITARDTMIQHGYSPELADKFAQQMAHNTWDSESQGGNAVMRAANNIPGGGTLQQMMASTQPTTPSSMQVPSGQSPQTQLPYTTDAFSSGAVNSRPTIPNQSPNFSL